MSSIPAQGAGAAPAFISISGVGHSYRGARRPALSDVSFTIAQGSCFGLLGPNGAGKSTLFGLLTGVLKLQQGDINVGGVSARGDLKALRAQGAIAPQELAFYPDLTGRQNLDFFAGAYRLERHVWRARVERAVEICQLPDVLDQRAETYSGGVKRRLNLAIALLNEPRVLYLDEPTVGIDARSRRLIVDAIAALKRAGATIIYTSHYMEEVETLCDTVAVIDLGRVVASGSIAEVLRAHGRSVLEITLAAPAPDALRAALTTLGATWTDATHAALSAVDQGSLNRALDTLVQSGAAIAHMQYGVARLEQAYLSVLHQGDAA
jgi:ABC-2 type transport system ATP-binding protein